MCGMRAIMLVALCTSQALAAPDGADEFAHVNLADLRQCLLRVLPDGLTWSDDKLVLGERGEPYWLPALRAEQAGFYVLRHSFRFDEATRGELGKGGQHHETYYFHVGKKGASRAQFAGTPAVRESQFDGRYPTACEGDVIVAPFRVAARLVDHEFAHDGFDEKQTNIIRSMIEEPARWLRDVADSRSPGCELVNQAGSRLRLLGTKMERGLSRLIPGPTFYEWLAAFEAGRVGEFNLRFDGPQGADVPPPIPIRIVDAKSSLRVVLTNFAIDVQSIDSQGISTIGHRAGHFPISGHALRVGDRFRITCLSHRHSAADNRPRIENPTITASAEPFALSAWLPFGVEPAKIE